VTELMEIWLAGSFILVWPSVRCGMIDGVVCGVISE
jgi:hypothetical protein